MGSCISKCCPNPSSEDPNPLQDKLMISQSPATTLTNPQPDHNLIISNPPSSSSSSSTSNSLNTSTCSFSSSSSSKDQSFSNEFLISCARKNPHIIVLDPHSHSSPKPKPTLRLLRRSNSPSNPARLPPKQSERTTNQSLPIKRARSGSPPSFARQKSFKSGVSSKVPPPPPPRRRMTDGPTSNAMQTHEIGSSSNAKAISLAAARKEKVQALNPCNPSSMRSSSREKAASVHQIHWVHPQGIQNGRREVLSNQSVGIPLVEDMDNPLISMDCFIFL